MADEENPSPFDLREHFIDLEDGGAARTLKVGPEFWPNLMSGQVNVGRLMGVLDIASDPQHWEMHPEGEEILVLLSGAMDLHLEEGGETRCAALAPGMTYLVPRGTWHRFTVREPSQLLFATAGAGTQTRPL